MFHEGGEDVELMDTFAAHCDEHSSIIAEKMDLLPNMKPFRNGTNVTGPKGSIYTGGLTNPPGATFVGSSFDAAPTQLEYADFSDTEGEESSEGDHE